VRIVAEEISWDLDGEVLQEQTIGTSNERLKAILFIFELLRPSVMVFARY
jgi:hypothetical protein